MVVRVMPIDLGSRLAALTLLSAGACALMLLQLGIIKEKEEEEKERHHEIRPPRKKKGKFRDRCPSPEARTCLLAEHEVSSDAAYRLGAILSRRMMDTDECPTSVFDNPSMSSLPCQGIGNMLGDYCAHLARFCLVDMAGLFFAWAYMDRISAPGPLQIPLTTKNVHRMILISFLLASKFLDDSAPTNKQFAWYGRISLAELKFLEGSLLEILNFRLMVKPTEYRFRACAIAAMSPSSFSLQPIWYKPVCRW